MKVGQNSSPMSSVAYALTQLKTAAAAATTTWWNQIQFGYEGVLP